MGVCRRTGEKVIQICNNLHVLYGTGVQVDRQARVSSMLHVCMYVIQKQKQQECVSVSELVVPGTGRQSYSRLKYI